ncbi:probable LRR receptor-like serine/threonine-protein kinase RKF3 [Cryptomeria japonica]|uniref:probable LRR receptor-like serine/threonine-protein kinase RKF3 n=1 Tax=Cryptomeria japonica TaxID=3369 RepID=UPI0027DA8124|nr:probable LRR receptor-like serine/threonine-protein kinase RKF3 [Cryptomeria japonica]
MSEIKEATGNFVESNLIGEGSFGMVYRGTLADGSRIAVKRFKDFRQRAEEEFSHEVQVISSTKHRNLLPLKGYSVGIIDQDPEQVLVYDLMENGSLADYFFSSTRPCLTWPQRFKIVVGIARGLAYLHEDAKPAIIHRDVKAANVLLDEDLSPLVADFGMAKFKTKDKTHYTTRTVGTLGYVAPEYALYGHLNDKSDVFSFGIIVLELLTGRRAFDSRTDRLEHVLISDWVVEMSQNGKSAEIIDERIRDSGCKKTMERVLLLALQCAHPRVGCRPSISKALLILESIDHSSPNMICALQSMELDLESSCNSRGDFTWLMSSDTGDAFFSSNSTSTSNSREFTG